VTPITMRSNQSSAREAEEDWSEQRWRRKEDGEDADALHLPRRIPWIPGGESIVKHIAGVTRPAAFPDGPELGTTRVCPQRSSCPHKVLSAVRDLCAGSLLLQGTGNVTPRRSGEYPNGSSTLS
jgi:hypothetical protein